jgi:NADH dehydrogenase [ubiquinone] 1 alpha subcomplex assembly factor 1
LTRAPVAPTITIAPSSSELATLREYHAVVHSIALALCVLSQPQEGPAPIEFKVHSGFVEKAPSGLPETISYLTFTDQTDFDNAFGAAPSTDPRPDVLPADTFASGMVVAVVNRSAEIRDCQLESLAVDDGRLVVKYRTSSREGADARPASPLIVSVPGKKYADVLFVKVAAEPNAPQQDPAGRTLYDFAAPNAAQAWQPVNDGVMGGVSDGRFKITEQGTMEFFGTLSLENNGGFASVRSRRGDLGLAPAGETLLIRLRGDGREYLLNLYVPALRIAYSYRAPIPTTAGEWTEVRIPLEDCYATSFGERVPDAGPLDPAKVNSLGLMLADKKAGPFKLEIAWVKVVKDPPAPARP